MAIKIQTEKPVIPIELGELKFEFELTDENIKRFYDTQDEIRKEFEEMNGDDLESTKEIVKKAFDYILGDGAFDKIYEVSPSIIIVVKYFQQIVEGLEVELLERAENTVQQKAKKYLANKKK